MTRDADQRIADILQAIDRCRRYVGALDSDDSDLETQPDPVAFAAREHPRRLADVIVEGVGS